MIITLTKLKGRIYLTSKNNFLIFIKKCKIEISNIYGGNSQCFTHKPFSFNWNRCGTSNSIKTRMIKKTKNNLNIQTNSNLPNLLTIRQNRENNQGYDWPAWEHISYSIACQIVCLLKFLSAVPQQSVDHQADRYGISHSFQIEKNWEVETHMW